MGPEVNIVAVELIQGNLYQIDLQIGDRHERIFIRQGELLKLLGEANMKSEEESDKQEWIGTLNKVISGEIEQGTMFIDDEPFTVEQAKKELEELLQS